MAVLGAASVLATLPGDSNGRSLSFAACVRKNRIRTGEQFADVGPHFISSYRLCNCWSLTGFVVQPFCERAARNSVSRSASEIMLRRLVCGMTSAAAPLWRFCRRAELARPEIGRAHV